MLHELQEHGDTNTRREAAWAVRQIEFAHNGPTSPKSADDDQPRDTAATQVVHCVPDVHARTALIPR